VFLFVFFQVENGYLLLRKVKFWNMPYSDILEAEKVWIRTKEIVSEVRFTTADGEIAKQTIGFKPQSGFAGTALISLGEAALFIGIIVLAAIIIVAIAQRLWN
jgi:hypothetical protein